jgi:hemerythrin
VVVNCGLFAQYFDFPRMFEGEIILLENLDIDQQHQELADKLNQLRNVINDRESLEVISRKIDDVFVYTRFHFEYEERLMDQYGYPELKLHMDRHKQLIHDVLKFKEKLEYVGYEEFLVWFKHWPLERIHAHIEYADKPFEQYLIQCDAK